ncbi:MarR family winged helix-turn-helix transcriptional regulator, partial [Chryseobacterium sp. SIMBA_029]|uniref:MarR family winged helix-turn-helix transcriptional regulator n=1 Tax=Chryseobacterium sp. SIMBA_029 TaxID=3085772 RepID=UPI003978E56B
VKTIGEKLDLDSGTLSPLLKRLEQNGLIKRIRDSRDERQGLVSLTPKGDAMRGEVDTIMGSIGQAIGCTLEEMAEIRTLLQGLRSNLNEAD